MRRMLIGSNCFSSMRLSTTSIATSSFWMNYSHKRKIFQVEREYLWSITCPFSIAVMPRAARGSKRTEEKDDDPDWREKSPKRKKSSTKAKGASKRASSPAAVAPKAKKLKTVVMRESVSKPRHADQIIGWEAERKMVMDLGYVASPEVTHMLWQHHNDPNLAAFFGDRPQVLKFLRTARKGVSTMINLAKYIPLGAPFGSPRLLCCTWLSSVSKTVSLRKCSMNSAMRT